MTDLELLTKFRRDLHRIPELSFDLPETCAYVRNVLESLSCEVTAPCESCVAAFFDVDAACGREPGGPATAIRADMDALPITENSGVEFCSAKPGHMHACGHDGHMAMALAAACWVDEALRGVRDGGACPLPRNVLFVFQPAEETTGGARIVCESGVFERYHADRIFGFHVWPDLPAGVVATRPGALLARASETHVTIHGTSSHIAKSADGNDALLASAHFLTSVEALMAELSAEEPCLLKFGLMQSGTVCNAISAETKVAGSLRVFSDEMFDRARADVDDLRALRQKPVRQRRGAVQIVAIHALVFVQHGGQIHARVVFVQNGVKGFKAIQRGFVRRNAHHLQPGLQSLLIHADSPTQI